MQYSKDPAVDRSLRHSVRDGMACSAMSGAGETYLSAFAIFMKASAAQVALLATVPPLLGALTQFVAAWLARRSPRRKPFVLLGATFQGLMWLAMFALPLRFPEYAPYILIGLATLYYAGGNLTAPLWMSWMGDLVPERRRGRFFGRRTRLTTMCSFGALVMGGVLLHVFDGNSATRWGFAGLFTFACLARLYSVSHLARMHEPQRAAAGCEQRLDRRWFAEVRSSGAPWFTAYIMLMQGAVAVSGPFFSIYMLRGLGFSYLEFMINTGTSVLVQFLTLSQWGRISDVFGNRLILSVTSLTLPLLPALWLVSDNFWYLLAVQVLSGLSWGGFSLSAGNLLYDVVPAAQRATYAASHNVLVAAGVCLGGLVGASLLPLLPERAVLFGAGAATPVLYIFLLSSLLRIMVAGLFLRRVKEIRRPRRRISPAVFIFRVTRFNAFVGFAYELFAPLKRSKAAALPQNVVVGPIRPLAAPTAGANEDELEPAKRRYG